MKCGFQVGERGKLKDPPRRSRRKHKRVSGPKSFSLGSGESWFHSKFDQT